MFSSTIKAHLALALAMLIWGSSFVVLKIAVNEMPPMFVVFVRLLIGSVAFLVVWPWLRQGFNYQKGDWKWLGGMALFEPCLYFLFEAEALRHTSAGQAGMVTAILPIMVAVAAFFFLGERNNKRQWAGFFIALLGVIWMTVTADESDQAPNPLLGNFLEFMAMCMAVGYTLLVKHLTKRYSPFVITATQSFIGAIFFLPLALWTSIPGNISMSGLASLIYLGLVVTLGAYGLFNFALSHIKASTATSYVNLLPVTSLMFSILFLGERLLTTQWVAIAVIFLGVYLSQDRSPRYPGDVPPGATG